MPRASPKAGKTGAGEGVKFLLRREGDRVVLAVESGSYRFMRYGGPVRL